MAAALLISEQLQLVIRRIASRNNSVPTVAATTTDTNASAVVTAATSIPGTTTIAVTAQDGVTTNTISIAWTLDR